MPEDPNATATPQTDPAAGTPTGTDGNTAQSTQSAPQPSDTYEERYKHLQVAFTQKSQEVATVRQELEQLKAHATAVPGTPPTEGETERERQYREALEAEQWARAQAVYGEDVIHAYDAYAKTYASDPTPVGVITALEAYHAARAAGATPAQAQQAATGTPLPTRQQAVEPRVDPNASGVSPDLAEFDKRISEAREKGDMVGWIAAQRAKVGL